MAVIGNLFRALTIFILSVIFLPILAFLLWAGWQMSGPISDVEVPIPLPSVRVGVQLWASWDSDGSFWLTAENSNGSVERSLWEDWGPARRSSFYLTAEGWLAVLAIGELVALIEFPSDGPPRSVGLEKRWRDSSDPSKEWTYIGAVDGLGPQYFILPTSTECVQTLGNLPMYRKEHAGGFCHTDDIRMLSDGKMVEP